MPLTVPKSVNTNGTVKATFVATIAAGSGIPTTTELNAVSSEELSCYITGEGLNWETSENTIEDPRLCSKQVFQARGDFTDSLEITYVFNPASAADNKAALKLVAGVKGFIALRWAVDVENVWAIANIIDVVPVEAGQPRKMTAARNGVHRIVQKLYVTGTVLRDVALIA